MWLIFIAAIAGETAIPEQAAPIEARAANDARAAIEARFQRIDRDRNGFITANEAPRIAVSRCQCGDAPAGASPAAGWIEDFDSDRDARVSADEYLARSLASQVSADLVRR